MIHWEDYREEGLPEILMQYRAVQDNPVADDPCPVSERSLIGIRNLFTDKNPEYWRQRIALETAFEERKKAEALARAKAQAPVQLTTAPTKWDGKGPCPSCGREPVDQSTLEAIERGRKWLEEHE